MRWPPTHQPDTRAECVENRYPGRVDEDDAGHGRERDSIDPDPGKRTPPPGRARSPDPTRGHVAAPGFGGETDLKPFLSPLKYSLFSDLW